MTAIVCILCVWPGARCGSTLSEHVKAAPGLFAKRALTPFDSPLSSASNAQASVSLFGAIGAPIQQHNQADGLMFQGVGVAAAGRKFLSQASHNLAYNSRTVLRLLAVEPCPGDGSPELSRLLGGVVVV